MGFATRLAVFPLKYGFITVGLQGNVAMTSAVPLHKDKLILYCAVCSGQDRKVAMT